MLRKQKNNKQLLTAVDLFSGGGGLSVGLKKAGFNVVAAVEIEPNAYATYVANHPGVRAFKQDIRELSGKELKKLSPTGEIDLLAGCPPCQGFSSLTAKYDHEDPRNELVMEMARLVKEIRPRAVMMENVPGLSKKGKPFLDEFLDSIVELGYIPTVEILQVADYGVPQFRRRLVVLAGHRFKIDMPKPKHSRNGEDGLQPWRTVRDAIGGMREPLTLSKSNEKGGPQAHNWHVVRTLAEVNKRRLKHAKPGMVWTNIPEELRPSCHKGEYRGFTNVYGRLEWNKVSATITGGCTTFSKGRFGHPIKNRTISVREAAIIQTFPKNYVIDTSYMDHACTIVGNALPCKFAAALSRQCAKKMRK